MFFPAILKKQQQISDSSSMMAAADTGWPNLSGHEPGGPGGGPGGGTGGGPGGADVSVGNQESIFLLLLFISISVIH